MRQFLLIMILTFMIASKATPAAAISSYEGHNCVELAVIRPMPLDATRALVPAAYKLVPGQDGLAQVSFALYRCESFTIDGAAASGGIVVENSVRIESPDGSLGRHAYLLHQVTTVKPLAEALGALSDVFELAAESTFEVGPRTPGGKNVARASVRSARFEGSWIGDPVTEPPDGPVEPNSKGVTFWLDHTSTQIQLDYRAKILPRSTGTITIRSGGADSTSTGAFLRADFTVRVTR